MTGGPGNECARSGSSSQEAGNSHLKQQHFSRFAVCRNAYTAIRKAHSIKACLLTSDETLSAYLELWKK
jgi:hypothetical protein